MIAVAEEVWKNPTPVCPSHVEGITSMPEQYTQLNSPVRFKALSLGDDDLLMTGLRGREGISQLFSFELDLLASIDKPVDFAEVLGRPAAVAMDVAKSETRYFHGIVNRFGQGARRHLHHLPHGAWFPSCGS